MSDLSIVAKLMNGKARERTQGPEFKSLTTRKYHVLLVTNACLEMVILSSASWRCNLRSIKGRFQVSSCMSFGKHTYPEPDPELFHPSRIFPRAPWLAVPAPQPHKKSGLLPIVLARWCSFQTLAHTESDRRYFFAPGIFHTAWC